MESGTECSIGMVLVFIKNIQGVQVMLLLGHFFLTKKDKNTRKSIMILGSLL